MVIYTGDHCHWYGDIHWWPLSRIWWYTLGTIVTDMAIHTGDHYNWYGDIHWWPLSLIWWYTLVCAL